MKGSNEYKEYKGKLEVAYKDEENKKIIKILDKSGSITNGSDFG
ncbi:hypothetical protein KQI42_19680 [Tissierella sp. MSJ-40]|uniref:Lipoprotein n=1 Tax=Tissierella simiarum TaxID=2841534 RepID=A0ABS6EBA9_9FIRM|nr:hypothetical protein [Tissierella simiarum]MBU5440219.1 hypothetical protein [Tissierella simiarum]